MRLKTCLKLIYILYYAESYAENCRNFTVLYTGTEARYLMLL